MKKICHVIINRYLCDVFETKMRLTITMKRYITLFAVCFMMLGRLCSQTGQFISSDRFSSSLISEICQDQKGSVWIATDYGLNRFDGYNFQTFLHHDADTTSISSNMVVSLLSDSKGNLWIGTSSGLDRFDPVSVSFVHYPFPNGYKPRVSCLLERHDGSLIVGTAGYGAYFLSQDGRLTAYAPISDHYVSRSYEDHKGNLWHSGFDDTITLYANGKSRKFTSAVGNPQAFIEQNDEVLIICLRGIMVWRNGQMQPADIDMSAVSGQDAVFTKASVGSNGIIYIGTRGRGIFRISPTHPRQIEKADINVFGVNQQTAKISAVMFDAKGNLWIACQQKGLILVPKHATHFASWSFQSQSINLGSTISSVCEGDGGVTWCTVQGVGVYGFNGDGRVIAHPKAPDAAEFIFRDRQNHFWVGTNDGLYSYDPLTGNSRLCFNFDCDKFNDMTSDNQGNIYVSTFSRGFCIYNPTTGALRNFDMNAPRDTVRGNLGNNWIMAMMPDSKGRLWLATSSGVSCYDPTADTFKPFGWEKLLDETMCYSLCETSSGNILIGTDHGLYAYTPGKQEAVSFDDSDELKDKVINYIVESNDGDIWCATSMGIWQYQKSTKTFIGHVAGNGLTKKEYITNVGMHSNDDRIYFGHNDGLTVFSPKNLKRQGTSPDPLQLSTFRVGDQYVNGNSVLNDVKVTGGLPVSECKYFTLSYLDHTVTLSFSQYTFDNAMNMTLEYRIGNGQWIRNPEGKNEFTLGHLQPGTYRIEVRALQSGAYTPSNTIVVTVKAPWYRSLMAYFIYFLLAASLLGYVLYTYRRHANQEMNEEKMKFLINATHDIRSPLTLILAALKKLDTGPATETIDHNAKRILNLVNQILDVRKIDKQQMQLHCQLTDIIGFTKGICKMFEYNAQERSINFNFKHEEFEELNVWLDRSQFEKVITNLLSNAFKYSFEGGSIDIQVTADEQQMKLAVSDTGVGLDNEGLKHIFERFYQGTNSRRLHIDGTGIGLNLCKMIVDMHHGSIEAKNRTDGQRGSVFTITLPLGKDHLKPEEIEEAPTFTSIPATQSSQKRRVLIVDDDIDIGKYISAELGHYYHFGLCSNGKEGLKELLTGSPYDVVISDVMMPEMDGFTMLRMIKTNMNISHLPVIMLTSKADVGNRLEGLERGADAFLAKPFDMEELHLTIDNLIQSRQRLKGKFTGAQQQADLVKQPIVKGNDEQLMERIMKVINKNLSDSDFNVDVLTHEVGISRAQLHRKMKEMTGISTSEFIRNIRLEQAARLLKEQKINVTQVAYTVGFSNLAHFSTIFRKHFGVSPSEYAEREQ